MAAAAAPPAELWQRWTAHDPHSSRRVDHQAWEAFLARYLRIGADGVHRVAYSRVTPADRSALDAYVAGFADLPISGYDRAEQLAYWINLYNALMVRVVLEHYPIATIRDVADRRRRAAPGLGTRSFSRSKANRSRSATSRTASCGRSGRIRGSSTRSAAARSAVRTCSRSPTRRTGSSTS